MCVSCTESILLWGLSADPPIVSVRNALNEAGSHVIFLDQRAVGDTEVELVVGTSVEGLLRAGRESFELAAVKAVYLRPHEKRKLPDVASAGEQSELWRHAEAVEDILLSWADLTPALVLNRPSDMAANGSKPYQASWVESLGLLPPPKVLTTDTAAVLEFLGQHERVIYKSISRIRSIK
jgi:hypothetical protein